MASTHAPSLGSSGQSPTIRRSAAPELAAVPFGHLSVQHAQLRAELLAAFDRVTEARTFILGEEVDRFEQAFADYCGTAHCVGVASGTAALTLGLLALGIEQDDEVIVPAHTFIASALGIIHAGARPVFCDVDRGTGLIDLDAAAAAVTTRTAAILPVHLYGQLCDMYGVQALADRHGLAVLEDAAQAHGATYDGRPAGSFGVAAAFSFYPSKNLGALGDGGAICTDSGDVAARARVLRNLGQRQKGQHVAAGFNERLDGVQAALLGVKLPYLDGWNERRRHNAVAYRRLLPDSIGLLEERPASPCVYHLFPVRVAHRQTLADGLAARGIQTGVHYSPALHQQPPLAQYGHEALPCAEAWAAEVLSLPMSESLTRAEIGQVTEAVATICAEL